MIFSGLSDDIRCGNFRIAGKTDFLRETWKKLGCCGIFLKRIYYSFSKLNNRL